MNALIRKSAPYVSVVFYLVLTAGCTGETPPAPQTQTVPVAAPAIVADLVIQGGQLLDMVADAPNPVPIKGLVVRDGKIDQILAAGSVEDLPEAKRTINAGPGYILPGLIDSHIHFRPWTPDAGIERRSNLYYGVTTLFDTGPCSSGCVETGRDPNEWIVAYKDFMDNPELTNGPTLYITGKKFDGPDGEEQPHSVRLQSLDEIVPMMDQLAGMGVDGIKVESSLPPDYRARVVQEANRRGLPVVGHSKDARESITAGMKFIEHMWPITSSIAISDPGREFNSPNHDHLMDLSKAPDLIKLMVDERVYLNPTMMGRYAHLSGRRDGFAEEDALLLTFGHVFNDIPEERKPETVAWMRRADRLDADQREQQQQGLQKVQAFLKQFSEAGGMVLAATDVNPPRLPGITMHRELQMLVDAGITPYRVLLGATRWAAEMMRKDDLIGTVEPGKQADILVLGSNPADEISNSKDIQYVIRKGTVQRSPDDCSVILPPVATTCKQ